MKGRTDKSMNFQFGPFFGACGILAELVKEACDEKCFQSVNWRKQVGDMV
jgi:hypothetical protein